MMAKQYLEDTVSVPLLYHRNTVCRRMRFLPSTTEMGKKTLGGRFIFISAKQMYLPGTKLCKDMAPFLPPYAFGAG